MILGEPTGDDGNWGIRIVESGHDEGDYEHYDLVVKKEIAGYA